MDHFYITARNEYGGFYDAASFSTLEEAKEALERLHYILEDARLGRSYSIRRAIAELSEQIETYEENCSQS